MRLVYEAGGLIPLERGTGRSWLPFKEAMALRDRSKGAALRQP
jgi:hypothetical protein